MIEENWCIWCWYFFWQKQNDIHSFKSTEYIIQHC